MSFQTIEYSGCHLILDLYGVSPKLLQDDVRLCEILQDAVKKSNATILHSYFHHFGTNFGVTGVIILAESHASIHTWPEKKYASVDIFMCGACDPRLAATYLKKAMFAEYFTESVLYRGTECDF